MSTIKQILLWLNIYGGSFSVISVLVAVTTFLIALGLQRKRHANNQLGLLKSLICELNYLGGEGEMQIGPIKRHSHLHWYEETFNKGGVPTHDMKDIEVNRYIVELDEKIKANSTRHLKDTLLFIHDCVVMVNRWTDEFLKLVQSEDNKEVKRMYVFVKQPIEHLKILVPEAIREIKTKWLSHSIPQEVPMQNLSNEQAETLRLVYQGQREESLQHRRTISYTFGWWLAGLMVILGGVISRRQMSVNMKWSVGLALVFLCSVFFYYIRQQRKESQKAMAVMISIERFLELYKEGAYLPGKSVLPARFAELPKTFIGVTWGDGLQILSLIILTFFVIATLLLIAVNP